jgi:hypothetical protein
VSGATALAQGGYWSAYLTPPPDMTRYRPGGIVVDVGRGQGGQLSALRDAGCRPIGLELAPKAARESHAIGHPVIINALERLPFRDGNCHGRPLQGGTLIHR